MNRYRALGLLLSAILWAAPVGRADAQPAGMRTVLDPGGRFSISFPSEWRVETSASGTPAVIGAAPTQPGEFRLNVNVVVETLPGEASPQDLATLAGTSLRTIFHEFTVVQEGPAQIGGRAAYYRYYTWRTNTGVSVYQIQVYFTAGRTGFVVTGSTLNDATRLRNDLPVLAQIIDTFRVTLAPGASAQRPGTSPHTPPPGV